MSRKSFMAKETLKSILKLIGVASATLFRIASGILWFIVMLQLLKFLNGV